jgi:hypothetical protein
MKRSKWAIRSWSTLVRQAYNRIVLVKSGDELTMKIDHRVEKRLVIRTLSYLFAADEYAIGARECWG